MGKTVFVGLSGGVDPKVERYAHTTGQAAPSVNKTVFVGLSGGVDSAVAAMLLKEKGFNVVGVFIKIWQPEFIECNWAKERLDAMRVAVSLGIPFREIDLSEEYKNEVVKKMIDEYSRGITPNPDVLCNRHIKFGSFLDYAKKESADFIATGHYARLEESNGVFSLLRAYDISKDQSYFLYTLEQSDLSHTLFPVGGLKKYEVRALAKKARLPVAGKPDSQGLCFVGDVSMKDFLSRFIKLKKGAVLDINGVEVGTHDGAPLYTIGQRHGFFVQHKNPKKKTYYLVRTNASANTVSVSANLKDAKCSGVLLNKINWISSEPVLPIEAFTQSRYHEMPVKSSISKTGERVTVMFGEPHISSPGQSLVIYDGDKCLGGGFVAESVNIE